MEQKNRDVVGSVLVVGAGIAGIQASLDLADSGYLVYLAERKSAIGGVMAQLDKTFPTNDCSMCVISPKLVEAGRHLNIELMTMTEVEEVSGEVGNFQVRLREEPRYIDIDKCTACGECEKACPIECSNTFDEGLRSRKAAFKLYPQGMPSAFAIDKRGTAPCKATCPAHVSIQGYIALISDGRYQEALELFKEAHPFPGVCGRVCHHPCEGECTRNDVDQPLAIRELHRFLADWENSQDRRFVPEITAEAREEKIAIIGSGPSGVTAAYCLALQGYQVTIFEKLPVTGGMMAVGIPEYRLPRDILANEIKMVEEMGVTIKTGVEFGKDVTLDGLKADGYKAVFLGIGLHGGRPLGVENEDAEGVLQGVDFLRDSAMGKDVPIGDDVLVIGGGNVAIDVALTAKRKGAKNVTLICLERRDEMPAWEHEIEEALEGDISIVNSLGPKAFFIDKDKKVSGLEFKTCSAVFDEQGRFNPQYDENECQPFFGDTVIISIGQSAVLDFAESQNVSVTPRGGLEADPLTLQTPLEWVFAGGDAFYGPKSVVDAVACGKEAAESIHRYVNGLDLTEGREKVWEYEKPDVSEESQQVRTPVRCLDPEARECNFLEVSFGYDEDEAKKEAERCLKCGICSECYQCVKACLAGAVDHSMIPRTRAINVGAVILAPGFTPFDPRKYKTYSYANHPNVLTALEFERVLSASGPYEGHLMRPSDHKEPDKIAWFQCVGSRDINQGDNSYCSSVCCMYANKQTVIAKEHSNKELDTAVFFMDMRTYGKDFEKYHMRTRDERGVRFIRSRVHTVEPLEDESLRIRYVTEEGEIVEEVFDMIVLSVGLAPNPDAMELARKLDIELNGHQHVRTSNLTPVMTSREGVYVCGAFQEPKDIPQSVMEASASASSATARLSVARGTLTRSRDLPPELDVSEQEPKVGVFVCNCGINIGGVADVPAIREYARSLPHVVHVEDNLFTCSQDTQDKMKEVIKETGMNRVVVASCSPRTHEPLFQETAPYVSNLTDKVRNHPNIRLFLKTEAVETTGVLGNFTTSLLTATPDGSVASTTVEHGATVLATGGKEYTPTEYLYGQNSNVLTHFEMDAAICAEDSRLTDAKTAVYIQCVGSRNDDRPYCSKLCCTHSLKSALTLKEMNPEIQIFILYRDIRSYGFREDLYKQAREQGIFFIRYSLDEMPQLTMNDQHEMTLTIKDHVLQRPIEISPDLVTLATAILPNDVKDISELFKVPVNADGFFVEAHAKLRPVDFASEGLFMAGLAHYPKPLEESIAQARAAVSRAMTILSKDAIWVGGVVASVEADRCAVCLTCVRACPYGVPQIGDDGAAVIEPASCHGCGICVSECPGKAISLQHFTDQQLIAKTDALFQDDPECKAA